MMRPIMHGVALVWVSLLNCVALPTTLSAQNIDPVGGDQNANANKANKKGAIEGDALFGLKRVTEIRLELQKDDWDNLRRQRRSFATAFTAMPNESPYTYFKADLWIDGIKIESVGVRKKGFLGSADEQRPSLKIKFDEYVDQDPVKGLNRLTLNNNKQDRSQASQYLAYQLFRNVGIPASRSGFAHVTVNGTSLGIYSNVESIKKPFLKHNFKNDRGNLYEGTITDFYPKALGRIEVKTNKKKGDHSDLKKLAEIVSAEGDLDVKALEKQIDLESFFRFWATEGLIGFWDGYSANQNNFFLYFDKRRDGKGVFIPWGADWTFSTRNPFGFGTRRGAQGVSVIYAQSMLANRLYHSQGMVQRYQTTLKSIIENHWNEKQMLTDLQRIESLVTPFLHRSQSATPQGLEEMRGFIKRRRTEVKSALADWNPGVPDQPRKPAYMVQVGKIAGPFTATFDDSPRARINQADQLTIEQDEKPLELEKLTVRIRNTSLPPTGFGGGGFGGGGFGAGFGGGRQPSNPIPPEERSITLDVVAEPVSGDRLTYSLTIERKDYQVNTRDPIRVTGQVLDQRNSGFGGSGFGGFGGGSRRSVIGTLTLTSAGQKTGEKVAGRLDLRLVESKGGLFQRRGRERTPRRSPSGSDRGKEKNVPSKEPQKGN